MVSEVKGRCVWGVVVGCVCCGSASNTQTIAAPRASMHSHWRRHLRFQGPHVQFREPRTASGLDALGSLSGLCSCEERGDGQPALPQALGDVSPHLKRGRVLYEVVYHRATLWRPLAHWH